MKKEQVEIALFRSSRMSAQIDPDLRPSVMMAEDKATLVEKVLALHPDFVIGDDRPLSLLLLKYLRKTRSATLAYAQILYGSHSISRYFDMSCVSLRDRIMFRSSQLVPFLVLSSKYSDRLRNCHGVLANSKLTATMLHILYDIDITGVVYPPVDTEVFKPTSREGKDCDQIMLYLGSHAGDSRMTDLQAIVRKAKDLGYRVNAMGNPKVAAKLKHEYEGLVWHRGIKDEELADLYSRSKATICPQKWETFGYVPAESMACGTPVIAFNCMGSQETVLDNVTGKLANNSKELLHQIGCVLSEKTSMFDKNELRSYVVRNFSVMVCADKLIGLLRNR